MARKLSHNEVTVTKLHVQHGTLVDRILRTFDRATPSDVEAGATWYAAARTLAVELAVESSENIGTDHAAAVIAHLSPRTSWERNVMGARELLLYGRKATGILGDNYDRALTALHSDAPLDSFTPRAPKTRNFAANIAGDDEAVTVDVWALRVVGLTEDDVRKVGVYDAVAHAYRLAAGRRGVSPATMQATTWIVQRGGRSE